MNNNQRSDFGITNILRGNTIALTARIIQWVGMLFFFFYFFTGLFIKLVSLDESNAEPAEVAGEILGVVSANMGLLTFILVLSFAGYLASFIYQYIGINELVRHFDQLGQKSIKTLRTALLIEMGSAGLVMFGSILLLIVTSFNYDIATIAITTFFTGLGLAVMAGVGGIVSLILNIVGYSDLRKSSTLNPDGVAAVRKLYMASIFLVIVACSGVIPIVGAIAALVLMVMYWVYIFSGWRALRSSMYSSVQEQN